MRAHYCFITLIKKIVSPANNNLLLLLLTTTTMVVATGVNKLKYRVHNILHTINKYFTKDIGK